ncbi:hypothetical protein BDIM_14490 [Brevundimonas diminuta ATCC 11568]|nr:hypothetical protein BDIM_14490 [Brevundimonas diminuta ATCC 11568]
MVKVHSVLPGKYDVGAEALAILKLNNVPRIGMPYSGAKRIYDNEYCNC